MVTIAVGSGRSPTPPHFLLITHIEYGVCVRVCNDITSLERENCRHILTASATLDESSSVPYCVRLPINTNSPIATPTNIIRCSYTSRLVEATGVLTFSIPFLPTNSYQT